jgi:hypothetical protein
MQNSFFTLTDFLKLFHLLYQNKYNFTCVFNNLEEILNKIMVIVEIFYYSQTIVLEVVLMKKF